MGGQGLVLLYRIQHVGRLMVSKMSTMNACLFTRQSTVIIERTSSQEPAQATIVG